MLEEMMAHPVFLVVVITAVLSFFFSLLVCMSFSASSPVLFSSFTLFMASFGSINFSQEKKTLVKERTNKEFLNKRDRTIF